jgi:hypothetical protein
MGRRAAAVSTSSLLDPKAERFQAAKKQLRFPRWSFVEHLEATKSA